MAAIHSAPRFISSPADTAPARPRRPGHDLRGVLLAAPVSLALWAVIALVVRAIV